MTTKHRAEETEKLEILDILAECEFDAEWKSKKIDDLKAEIEKYKDTIVECSFECEVQGVDNKALEANNATLGAEIEALKKEIQEREEFTKAWILYAAKIEMLMPTRVDRSMGSALGLSLEYQKGYNDAILEVKVSMKKASEKC